MPAVLLELDAQVAAPGVVEDRERQPRLEHLVRDLGGMERRLPRERPPLLRLEAVRIAVAPALVPPLGGQRLGAADQRDVELTREDLLGHAVDEDLRRRSADTRVVGVPRLDAEACREPRGRVVVLPRLAVHDLQAVEAVEDGRAGDARVVGGEAGDVLPHRERLGRAFLPYLVGVPRLLPDADEARRAWIDRCHDYFPCQFGLRFSVNALGPSLASSVWKIVELS